MPERVDPIAILSDIHGNAEAIAAVMRDIRELGIETVVNLGDTVGYGPDPETCIDIVSQQCAINLCGNHDYAVLHQAEGFNPVARAAVDYVRERLRPDADNPDPDQQRRWEFLKTLEPIHEDDRMEAMHASPRHPITEYVLPSDPDMDPDKVEAIFDAMRAPLAFVGHTHFPGIILRQQRQFYLPFQFPDMRYELEGDMAIVNVGSVGQPRDRDIRSCYVIFDGVSIQYRRVQYDVERTVQKVRSSGGLHEICGLRLREGR